ncbi:MAG TPA: molybdopterin oxidoreductase family protein, partial [Polyangiales bacterium]
IQWPLREGESLHANERRLFADGRYFTEDARARFVFDPPRSLPEPTSRAYPLLLLTGRGSSSQWHTQTRTKRSDVLLRLAPTEIYVEVSPSDAKQLNIQPDEMVSVASQRAKIQARAFITHTVKPGEVFIPMHYDAVNRLTLGAFDPHSRQPAYKACAVRLSKLDAHE